MKILTGNPGKRPMSENEPLPAGAIGRCPPHLDKEAKAEWRRMSKALGACGLLTDVDRPAFASYCVLWSTWVAAMLKVREEGAVVENSSGYPVQNPQLTVANNALKQMRAFLTEFGMTPSSRSRVTVAPKEKAPDKFETLLSGRKQA